MTHARGRSRWTALPVLMTLSISVLAAWPATPAAAAAASEYRGYLSTSAAGVRYVAYDPSGVLRFSSTPDAVDGALGAVIDAGPTVAYVSETGNDATHVDRLHVVPPGGADAVVYSGQPGADISDLAISPNGHDVLFALDDARSSALVSVDAAGGAARTLRTSTSTTYYGPSFSPDGAYVSWAQVGPIYSAVAVADVATLAASVLFQASVDNLVYTDTAWSPTSAEVVAVRNAYDASIDDTIASLEVVDVRSHVSHVPVRGQVTSTGAVVEYLEPSWARDGQTLLMTKLTTTASSVAGELVALPPNQGGFTEPVATTGYAGSPSAAAARTTDAVAPAAVTALSAAPVGASAHVTFTLPPDADLADLVVTRSQGAAADTPTADIEIARTWSGALDVPLPTPSTDYGISVFTRDWSGNLSPAAKVSVTSAPPTTLTVSTPPARISWRTGVKLTGTLTNPAGLYNDKVVLYVRRAQTSTFVAVATTHTSSSGAYTLTYNPQWTAEYQVRFAGSPRGYPTESDKRVVTVVPAINLWANITPIPLGRTVTLTGNVGPNHAGQLVTLQRKINGVWRNIGSIRLSSTSTYRTVIKPSTRGSWELRTYKAADGDHAATSSQGRPIPVR